MAQFEIQSNIQQIGELAASKTAETLNKAIKNHGNAVWVLAGGTAPLAAYRILAEQYQDAVDWSKVVVLIGDERCVPFDDVDSNWRHIAHILLDLVPIKVTNKLRPKSYLTAEKAAADYAKVLAELPKTKTGLPRLDLVWLGVGEDGHTLSLFPDHLSLQNTGLLVAPVHNSPKPPPDRITLTLEALQATTCCIVMAAGAGKAEIIAKVRRGDARLPIVKAVQTIEAANGEVTWLIDSTASGTTM